MPHQRHPADVRHLRIRRQHIGKSGGRALTRGDDQATVLDFQINDGAFVQTELNSKGLGMRSAGLAPQRRRTGKRYLSYWLDSLDMAPGLAGTRYFFTIPLARLRSLLNIRRSRIGTVAQTPDEAEE